MTSTSNISPQQQKQDWDHYWGNKKSRIAYDIIAEFYRKFIIRPSLNRFVNQYLPKGAKVLHAGCGSGQVDRDIRHEVQITGLDISPEGLKIYQHENGNYCQSMLGSIFQIPAEAN